MRSCYTIVISYQAKKEIGRLTQSIKDRIEDVLVNVLAGNPFFGKALKAELKGLYSHRVGDYRIIYSIIRRQLLIHVIKVMHRREVYR